MSSDDDSLPALSDPDLVPGSLPTPTPAPAPGRLAADLGKGERNRYERQGLLGEGGMGRVYAARDRRLRRQVALKVAATPELAERLATEAWITAQLEHPGIVAVYDAGERDGQAWYTMRLIRGRTLRERIRSCASAAERLSLLPHLLAATQAVAYAHAMGILHQDLKPANIMVGEFGETQVADWGLARPIDGAVEDWARIVSRGKLTGMAGTPRYMSPEQARGEPAGLPSDVFCLGAALAELITGVAPPEEAGRPPDLGAVPEDVPQDLVAIARRCLAPDPARRYPSAVELAEDLERFLAGRRVDAHDYAPTELLERLLRAWRAPLSVGGLALLALAAVGLVGARRTAAERAQAEANYAQALSQQALAALQSSRIPEARVLAASALAIEESPVARGVLAASGLGGAERISSAALPDNCTHDGHVSPDGRQLACVGQARFEVWQLPDMRLSWATELHVIDRPAWIGDALVVPTADALLWVSSEGVAPLVQERWSLHQARGGVFALQGARAVHIGPDGRPVHFDICPTTRAAVSVRGDRLSVGCNDGVLRLFDRAGRASEVMDLRDRPAWATSVWSGDRLLVGGLDGSVRRLAPDSGARESAALTGSLGAVGEILPVPEAELALVHSERGGPRLWNTAAGAWVGALPAGASRMYRGPASREVWLLGDHLERWRLPASPRPTVFDFGPGVAQVSVSADGGQMAVALGSGEVVTRRLSDGMETGRWRLGEGVAKSVSFTREGRLVGSAVAEDARILGPGDAVTPVGRGHVFRRLGRLADGRIWGISYSPAVRLFDDESGQELAAQTQVRFFDGSSSPDGSTAVIGDESGGIWRLEGSEWIRVREEPDLAAVDVGDGGAPLVWARRRDLCTDAGCVRIEGTVVDISTAGPWVAVATLAGDVWLLDREDLATRALLRGHDGRVASVEFGPGGRWLLSGSWDGTVRRWELGDLDTPAEVLLRESQDTWGLSIEAALRGQ